MKRLSLATLVMLAGCTSTAKFVTPDLSGVEPLTDATGLDGGPAPDGAPDLLSIDASEGGAAVLAASQSTLKFGKVTAGTPSSALSVTFSNSGYQSLISGVTVTGAGFILADESCVGQTLDGSATCSASVRFEPAATNVFSGSLTITGSSGGSVTVALSGLGVEPGAVGFTPATFSFGMVTNMTTASPDGRFSLGNASLVNSGPITATLTGGGSNTIFIVSNNCTAGLAAGATCSIVVRFTAGATTGATSATLTAVDEQGQSATVALSATVQ